MSDRPDSPFKGHLGLCEFLNTHYHVTGNPDNQVPRSDLLARYTAFCSHSAHPVASEVDVGKFLDKFGVRQMYVGLECNKMKLSSL